MQQLGKQIKSLRVRLGMSQGKLAELTQLSRCVVDDIEQGREKLSLDTLMRIAVCLNAEPWEMLLAGAALDNVCDAPLVRQIH